MFAGIVRGHLSCAYGLTSDARDLSSRSNSVRQDANFHRRKRHDELCCPGVREGYTTGRDIFLDEDHTVISPNSYALPITMNARYKSRLITKGT